MFKHSDKVWILKHKDAESYFAVFENHWTFVDNIMECKYFKSRGEAEESFDKYSYLEGTRTDYEIICITYEFYWTYVEE